MRAFACLLVLVGPLVVAPASAQQHDADALQACVTLRDGLRRFTDGAVGIYGLSIEMRSVYRQAERSTDAGLRQRAGQLVRTSDALPRQTDPFLAVLRDTVGYCTGSVLLGVKDGTLVIGPKGSPPLQLEPPRPAAKPLTPAELEQQTKRAGEKSGSQKCETKTYGGGAAVTVCD